MYKCEFNIITLSSFAFESIVKDGILQRAQNKNILKINIFNLRDFTEDKHRVVDDYTYGGGCGMVLKPEPIFKAVEEISRRYDKKPHVILTSPQGKLFSQSIAQRYSEKQSIIIICGRYEGVDARVREYLVDEEISIGDYILSSGDIPAMVIMDAVARLLPGVLEKEEAKIFESFSHGLLEYPQYTRPRNFRGMKVPQILLCGNHKEISRWRRYESLKLTFKLRPDLLERAKLDEEDIKMLNEIRRNNK